MKKSPAFRNYFKGIIIPDAWDSSGNIVGISLHTHDEKTYVIEPSRIGNELYKYIRHSVLVNGKIRQRLDGRTLIRVINYKVITASAHQIAKVS